MGSLFVNVFVASGVMVESNCDGRVTVEVLASWWDALNAKGKRELQKRLLGCLVRSYIVRPPSSRGQVVQVSVGPLHVQTARMSVTSLRGLSLFWRVLLLSILVSVSVGLLLVV